jgi:predicted glutamine amidotransferase
MVEMGNRDGFGLMWVEGERSAKGHIKGSTGRVRKIQSMAKPEDVAKIYAEHMDNNIAIHVRNATLGEENEENCHPITILSKDLGHKIDLEMMHNGTIKDVQVDKKFSDSYNFGTKFLRGLLERQGWQLLYDEEFKRFLCAIIGPNKLLFLNSFERFLVVNRDMWSIHSPSGCLVSTSSDIKVYEAPYIYTKPIQDKSGVEKIDTVSWQYPDGTWHMDADGRSNFIPKKDQGDVGANDTTGDQKEASTDNGIQWLSLDEEAVKEWVEKIKGWDQASISAFVMETPVEALEVATYLASKNKDHPITEEEYTNTGMMIATQPEQAAKQLYVLVETWGSENVPAKES